VADAHDFVPGQLAEKLMRSYAAGLAAALPIL
jgi:hypothetical protein